MAVATTIAAHNLAAIAPPGNPEDFVILDGRPVFKEHWTRQVLDDDGEVLHESRYIGREALERIAQRCNERILDTGDFSVICIRHNDDEGSRDPEVVGFAGPFVVGRVGNLKPKWAILAKLWIYKQDVDCLRKYPRLSVEYWADENDPTNGYFDPISLLGGETPELDLGIRYSKNAETGVRRFCYRRITPMKYEAASPGGSNAFVAGTPSKRGDQPVTYDKQPPEEKPMAGTLTKEDLDQIVQAFMPVVQAMVEDAMESKDSETDPNAQLSEEPPMELDAGAPGEVPEAAPPMDDTRPSIDGGPGEDQAMMGGEPDGDEESPAMSKASKYRKERDDYALKYRKECDAHRATVAKYQKLEAEVESARKAKRKAERYQKLTSLNNEGFVFDADEELNDTESMNDDQFSRHCERIVARYQRVPNGSLPQSRPTARTGEFGNSERVERFAKQAREHVERLKKQDPSIDTLAEMKKEIARLEQAEPAKVTPV